MAWAAAEWTESLCKQLRVERGQSTYLAFFEAFTVLSAMALWSGPGQETEIAIVGDNLAALTVAVSRRGRGDLGRICRELALRQARHGLVISVGHLASKLNTWADTLSRLAAPAPAEVPLELRSVRRWPWPDLGDLFTISSHVVV